MENYFTAGGSESLSAFLSGLSNPLETGRLGQGALEVDWEKGASLSFSKGGREQNRKPSLVLARGRYKCLEFRGGEFTCSRRSSGQSMHAQTQARPHIHSPGAAGMSGMLR